MASRLVGRRRDARGAKHTAVRIRPVTRLPSARARREPQLIGVVENSQRVIHATQVPGPANVQEAANSRELTVTTTETRCPTDRSGKTLRHRIGKPFALINRPFTGTRSDRLPLGAG